MKKLCLLGMVSLMVLGLASTSHASSTHFMVSMSASQTGYKPQLGPTGSNFYSWSDDVYALDNVADGVSVTDSSAFTQTCTIGWTPASGFQTVYTLDYSISAELLTDIVGDWATGDITITASIDGSSISDTDTYSWSVADGTDVSPADTITGSVSVTTPTGIIGGSNYGTLRLTVAINGEAFMEVVPVEPEPEPEPVVPAPGAVVLGSLGAGLVGWLRRRRAM